MKSSLFATLVFAITVTAAPTLETRQNASSAVLQSSSQNNGRLQTIQVTDIDWQRDGNTINGIGFQATIQGANPAESYRCTSDSPESVEGFAPIKVGLCAKGSPITFAYKNESGSSLQLWYTNALKSYSGSVATTPGNTTPLTIPLSEIEASTSTP